ncbi:uncharacterized protein LOC120459779 [Pimephales promelas]|uniref:uncharacterized protein LOC120459779 n=1 Tax=Pimephales promelas TaxID=90988 RepID=UPI0019558B38|nr:uncharacterized protein LOC120459779 [Pimephales promelas]
MKPSRRIYLQSWRATRRTLQNLHASQAENARASQTENLTHQNPESLNRDAFMACDERDGDGIVMDDVSDLKRDKSVNEDNLFEDGVHESCDGHKSGMESPCSDSVSSDSDLDNHSDGTLFEALAAWTSEFQVKHNAVDRLLKLLQSHGHPQLPSTARTLLKTPREVKTVEKSGMVSLHYQLKEKLVETLDRYPVQLVSDLETLELSFNVDGLPLFKSSGKSMWPVLCAVMLSPVTIFPTTLTCGLKKPTDLGFLEDTVKDLAEILTNGLDYRGRNIKVTVRCFVCDAPARAMIKNTKCYSGYYGCERCTQQGLWLNRVTYPETSDLELRTDASFRAQTQPEHHHGNTPLSDLPIDMVQSFPIDYMHQVCLGVTKKLLYIWCRGEKGMRISASQVQELSSRLLMLKSSIPSTFARSPRGLDELERWKATEFRQFLLYTGKLVLKGVLREDLYNHFLTLSVAVGLLVCPTLVQQYHDYAHQLLQYFVEKGCELYGHTFLVYNIHTMLHLSTDAVCFKGLDNCSGFMFENYLQAIKKMVRSGKSSLAQVANRLEETMQFVFDSGVPIPQEEHTDEEDFYNRTLEERHTSRLGADYNFYGSSTSGLKKVENGSEGLRPRGKS